MHTVTHSQNSPAQTNGLVLRWATIYDRVMDVATLGKNQRLRKLTIDLAQLKPGDTFLDVGCGTGGVTIPGKRRVGPTGKAMGIDPSPEMITVARKKADQAGVEVDFRLGVIESLPYPESTFDAVTSSLMFHHLTDELRIKGLAEIFRVLKPGGRLVIADMTRPTGFFLKKITARLSRRQGLKFGIEDLPQLMKAAGFNQATQQDVRFGMIGFVSAVKPAA